jgi:hypothetical protein
MLYREIIAVCSEIHTKHIDTLCGQKVDLLNVKLVVHIVTTGLKWVKGLSLSGHVMEEFGSKNTTSRWSVSPFR